ncbi:helix-turn-helix domain-containing protein [Pseudomonas jinjuensis]|uniref:Helix-turn-helix n=1 Tax=Pseudomonas jinjuensis TaxID=198616 RepID=A0A1H0D6E1_9PSED|nr:helix-turn-helix transcriptional regulator [Pseudomonas jinjuensis]SDN65732.1 Helix-turn-helix [Pseudomonas jinjuensis]
MNNLPAEERHKLLEDIQLQNALGKETLGTSIRRLRVEVTGLDQETFASMCRMSTKALYQLESDKGNPTINTLNGILRMFGMTMTLGSIRTSPVVPAENRVAIRKRGARPVSRKSNAQGE